MKFVIAVVIIVGLSLGVRQLYQYWGTFREKAPAVVAAPAEVPEEQLPGLPDSLQPALEEARQHGAAGLRSFLEAHGKSIQDPRRASIELDYVLLATQSNPGEARRVFGKVKERLTPESPVYDRMKKLEKTYE
jgi:hypothetical protein